MCTEDEDIVVGIMQGEYANNPARQRVVGRLCGHWTRHFDKDLVNGSWVNSDLFLFRHMWKKSARFGVGRMVLPP